MPRGGSRADESAVGNDDALLDREALRTLASDDPELPALLIAQFEQDAPQRIAALHAALDAGDADAVRRAAHLFKGEASTMGARALEAICLELEQAGTRSVLAGADGLLARLDATYARTQAAWLPSSSLRTRAQSPVEPTLEGLSMIPLQDLS